MKDVPKSRVDATLKKIAENTSKANIPISLSTSLGDPNCPHCGGQGYLRSDVPMGHPNFGRLDVCVCRQADVSQQVRERLYSLSRLDELKDLTFATFQPRGPRDWAKCKPLHWKWLSISHIIMLKI
jgi:DNA replication protein DnaC